MIFAFSIGILNATRMGLIAHPTPTASTAILSSRFRTKAAMHALEPEGCFAPMGTDLAFAALVQWQRPMKTLVPNWKEPHTGLTARTVRTTDSMVAKPARPMVASGAARTPFAFRPEPLRPTVPFARLPRIMSTFARLPTTIPFRIPCLMP